MFQAIAAICIAVSSVSCFAQDIRIIAPFSPGGNLDMTARFVAKGLGEHLKRPVIVENKPGAGGMVGGAYVARSSPDGTTLLLASPSTIFGGPLLQGAKAPYDYRELTPIGPVTRTPLLLVVKGESEFQTFAQLEKAARAKRNLSFAHPGVGTINQIAIFKLEDELQADFIHVPFKGSIDGLQELLAGRIDVSIAEITVSKQFLDSGRVRALAVIGDSRASALPDVPTLKELGITQVEGNIYTALMAPAKTPENVIVDLNRSLNQILTEDDIKTAFSQLGVEVMSMSLAQFQDTVNRDATRFKGLVDTGVISIK